MGSLWCCTTDYLIREINWYILRCDIHHSMAMTTIIFIMAIIYQTFKYTQ